MARIVGQKHHPYRPPFLFDSNIAITEIVNYSIVDNSHGDNNINTSNPFLAATQTYRISLVATLSTFPAGGIVESASAFFGTGAQHTASRHGRPENNKHERAMARRLEQLHAALGESDAPSAKAANIEQRPVAIASAHAFGTGSLIITALISALLGASMMRLGETQAQTPAHRAPAPQATAAAPTTSPVLLEAALNAPGSAESSDKTNISALLDTWRSAWAQRDIASYLNAYSQQFTPTDGNTREAWVAARTKKLSVGAPIDIQVRELGIERLNADQFKVTFLQDYASGSYREMARTKVLLIVRENDEWKIAKEWLAENKLAAK
ncbi:MAG: nuclear transport factor 2 family protein [Azonexaceae bacterium]|nr:nuclear transport factor 2 family protein [Azonexaceae bacterium]